MVKLHAELSRNECQGWGCGAFTFSICGQTSLGCSHIGSSITRQRLIALYLQCGTNAT